VTRDGERDNRFTVRFSIVKITFKLENGFDFRLTELSEDLYFFNGILTLNCIRVRLQSGTTKKVLLGIFLVIVHIFLLTLNWIRVRLQPSTTKKALLGKFLPIVHIF